MLVGHSHRYIKQLARGGMFYQQKSPSTSDSRACSELAVGRPKAPSCSLKLECQPKLVEVIFPHPLKEVEIILTVCSDTTYRGDGDYSIGK